jgi:hypothetical protein
MKLRMLVGRRMKCFLECSGLDPIKKMRCEKNLEIVEGIIHIDI